MDIYAVRRSLERMKGRREKILEDPEGYRQEQIKKRVPEDFEDFPEDEQDAILTELEGIVASVEPLALKEEILQLGKLIDQATRLERMEVETKLTKLREVLTEEGIFDDPKMKLLLFTEHKDTKDKSWISNTPNASSRWIFLANIAREILARILW